MGMKLLVVTATYPFPPRTGTATLAYNHIKELSQRHSVHLVCIDAPADRGDLEKFTEQVDLVGRKRFPRLIGPVRPLFWLLMGIPAAVAVQKSRAMRKRVAELIGRGQFDAILMYEMNSIQFCPPSARKRAIVNIEDPPSIRLVRMRGLSAWSSLQRLKLFVYARLMARYEKRFLDSMGRIVVLSEADMRDMRQGGAHENLGHVSYGVDVKSPHDVISQDSRSEGMIVFSGNMYHAPNVDGALFFLRDVFPLVLEDYPTAALWIVGAAPDSRIRRAAEEFGDHIVVTGEVDDISAYLRRAKVSICPVRLKIGVQTKVLEALAWGTPVVTTNAGNSGVAGRSGTDLWVEDEPGRFASRVVALLRGEGWQALSEGGRKLVTEQFSWKRSVRELEQQIELLQAANR
jgi:glycosyltransferase involved in cell wall biosynthesis